jgi:hypothetical protein
MKPAGSEDRRYFRQDTLFVPFRRRNPSKIRLPGTNHFPDPERQKDLSDKRNEISPEEHP